MKTDEIMDSWNELDPEYIESAGQKRRGGRRRSGRSRTAVLIAAAVLLTAGIASGVVLIIKNNSHGPGSVASDLPVGTSENAVTKAPQEERAEEKLDMEQLQNLSQAVFAYAGQLREEDRDTYIRGTMSGGIDEARGEITIEITHNDALAEKLRERYAEYPMIMISSSNPEPEKSTDHPDDPEECSISPVFVSWDAAEAAVTTAYTSSRENDLTYGCGFSLERLENGEWMTLKAPLMFTAEAYPLSPGQTAEWTDVLFGYGVLPAGHYRVIRDFYDSETRDPFRIASEFDIE